MQLKSSLQLVLAVAVLAAAGLVLFLRADNGTRAGTQPLNTTGAPLVEERAPTAPSRMAVDELRASAELAEAPGKLAAPAGESKLAQARGRVVGMVFDLDGTPHPRFPFVLMPLVEGALGATGSSDDFGEYTVEVPPGTYRIIDQSGQTSDTFLEQGRVLGEVTVQAGVPTPYDIMLCAGVALSGRVRAVHPSFEGAPVGLRLELRRASDPGGIVAQGETAATDLASYLASSGNEPVDPETGVELTEESRTDVYTGAFTFTDLEPDFYVLRVVLGETEKGEPLHVEREIDLTRGDVTLVDEAIPAELFVQHDRRPGKAR